jgi:hypothetical protein
MIQRQYVRPAKMADEYLNSIVAKGGSLPPKYHFRRDYGMGLGWLRRSQIRALDAAMNKWDYHRTVHHLGTLDQLIKDGVLGPVGRDDQRNARSRVLLVTYEHRVR